MPLKRVQRLAKIIDASFKDAGRARRLSRSPKAQQEIVNDRRGALSQFATVKDALKDRERAARAARASRGAAKEASGPGKPAAGRGAATSRKPAPPKAGRQSRG